MALTLCRVQYSKYAPAAEPTNDMPSELKHQVQDDTYGRQDEGPRGDSQNRLVRLAHHSWACSRDVCEVSAPIEGLALVGAILAIQTDYGRARAKVPARTAIRVALVQRAPKARQEGRGRLALVVLQHLIHELLEVEGPHERQTCRDQRHAREHDL
eukprot:CAMPEP_0177408126 /NCGR_PEP_ID=MMETSP0368-20130122/63500_1 /TAXON_ID=447022 ORGANISM="Scrippsiella hangoei-like, Strain SHHI-4" /NCGR_SAMPLE_ID=MMETSP0368 /ASSEMBLY_ACC=CAM_ASM_000363 /LENGTH=155 /DNA_ID=CAMNT_0018876719 /DNA_START=149 /DNA_END=616 /DNA_ORIENTATION=-